MVFPDSRWVIFNKNPLKQVICQLRFPPILAITSQEPVAFQELVRGTHPGYERALTIIPKAFADLLASLPVPQNVLPEGIVYKFFTLDRKTEIDLTRDSVSVATTSYKRWEEFEAVIRLAKEALETTYEPTSYSRIGLRYIDVIERETCGLSQVPWKDLIKSSVVGLLAESHTNITDHIAAMNSQTLFTLGLPDENLMVRNGFMSATAEGTQQYGIDADFYKEGNSASGEVLAILRRFNREARNFFNWVITDRLRDALEPIPVP